MSSLETCSSPQNTVIYTWASLWSPTWDARPTGEDVLYWRSRTYWFAQNDLQRPANQERMSLSEMRWHEKRMVAHPTTSKRLKKEQSTITWSAEPPGVPAVPIGPSVETPILPCPENRMLQVAQGEWTRQKTPQARTARIVRQNVGPIGLRKTIPVIQRIINSQRPSIIFLQDCKVRENDHTAITTLRKSFPQYNLFIRSGHRQETRRIRLKAGSLRHYQFSVMTLVHDGCGKAQEYKVDTPNALHRGSILTIRVEPANQSPFLATNVYNYTTSEAPQQLELFKLLSSRVKEAQGITHIIAGASLLGEYRKGYASNSSSRQSDMMFNDFVRQSSLQRRWWTGQLIEGMWTRRNPSKTQLSLLDELLILHKAELPLELHARTRGGHGIHACIGPLYLGC